ncbi:MAG: DUF2587 domain-containing protein [Promicromonosporaceae bacterium]|nr:DUF2587 domain-containing protein [Promicromonosporaceae bacterium]
MNDETTTGTDAAPDGGATSADVGHDDPPANAQVDQPGEGAAVEPGTPAPTSSEPTTSGTATPEPEPSELEASDSGATPPATGSPADEDAPSAAGDNPETQAPAGTTDEDDHPAVEDPAKVMRIAGSVKRLLDEVREVELDEEARDRLAQIHLRSLKELESGLSDELAEELERLTEPFADHERPPSTAELRIAQAQLIGWLEGLFHGLQTAMMAHQIATAVGQATGGGKGMPGGVMVAISGADGPPVPGLPGATGPRDENADRPGQYL